jgi:hypothetical protein
MLSACTAPDAVHVNLKYAAERSSAPLEKLRVFAGANKSSWPALQPGESVSVVLPPDGEPPQVTMTYRLASVQREWRGPSMATGVGYRIEITVSSDGSVSEQHCETPCSLR